MAQGTVNYALIGCGMIAGYHARAIERIPTARLMGVCGANSTESLSAANRFRTHAYLSAEEIWADPRVDAVCICTPSGLHGDQALEAVRHSRHVLIEKPMAMTLEQCDAILAEADRRGLKVGVVSQLRYSPSVCQVKHVMSQGRLGKMVSADLYMKYYRSQEYYDSSSWRGTRNMDGGALMNQGIHGVDLLRYLAGPVRTIYAQSATRLRRMEAEDTLSAVLEYVDGSLGVIEASTCVRPGFARRIELCGERGTIILEEDRIQLWEVDGVPAPELRDDSDPSYYGISRPDAIDDEGHYRQLSNFTAAVLGEELLLNDGLEGRRTVQIILAAYTSAATGRPVALSV